jgi:hypothetical protein
MIDSPRNYHYLVALVHKLVDKIDGLERKIDRLIGKNMGPGPSRGEDFPAVSPPVAFLEWVDSFVVSTENLEVICQQHILEGFKHCLIQNCRQGAPPLLVKGRSRHLYVFGVKSGAECGTFPRFDARISVAEGFTKELNEVFPDASNDCEDEMEAHWQPFTDHHLDHLIQDLWRKILERFLNDTELFAEEEDERVQNYRDLCMKKILEMRKLLALRHRKEIVRCLVAATRDKNIL